MAAKEFAVIHSNALFRRRRRHLFSVGAGRMDREYLDIMETSRMASKRFYLLKDVGYLTWLDMDEEHCSFQLTYISRINLYVHRGIFRW